MKNRRNTTSKKTTVAGVALLAVGLCGGQLGVSSPGASEEEQSEAELRAEYVRLARERAETMSETELKAALKKMRAAARETRARAAVREAVDLEALRRIVDKYPNTRTAVRVQRVIQLLTEPERSHVGGGFF